MSQAQTPVGRPELARQLESLRQVVADMGERVATAVGRSVWAFTERNPDLASLVLEEDGKLNDLQHRAHELSYVAILTQAPVATDLREILSLLHMAGELERMGDHCVSISKLARGLVDLPPPRDDAGFPGLADLCSHQVRDILVAVIERDQAAARSVAARDDAIDQRYHRLFNQLVRLMTEDPHTVYAATTMIFMAHHLERIGDRVTNIAEDLIFLESGAIEELD